MIADHVASLLDRYDQLAASAAPAVEWAGLANDFDRVARLIAHVPVEAPDRAETLDMLRAFASKCRERPVAKEMS